MGSDWEARNLALSGKGVYSDRMQIPWRVVVSLVVLWSGHAAEVSIDSPPLPPASTAPVEFERDIRPLFVDRCYSCHGPEKQKSGFRLDRRQEALEGGDSGPALVPGQSSESRLIQLVAGLDGDRVMPPQGDRLSSTQIGQLRAWIDQGAKW